MYIYILTNKTKNVLYTGVSNNLCRRMREHRSDSIEGFTKQYHVHRLVYYEAHEDSYTAISREKQLKAGSRKRKVELIESINPEWRDLFQELCGDDDYL